MNTEGRTIWQVAAGNGNNTHYAQSCLKENVVLIGPGHCGAWPYCERLLQEDNVSARRVGIIKQFAENMRTNDLVVLRVGTQQVFGVGELVGSYGWSEDYKDIQGWDLQHFRRVRWLWHQNGKPKTFPVYSLKLGSSIQKLTSPEVSHWLKSLDVVEAA